MNITKGIVCGIKSDSAPRLVDCSWTLEICLEKQNSLSFGAVDKSTLPLKRPIELIPDTLA